MNSNPALRETVTLDEQSAPALSAGPGLLIGLGPGDRPVTLPDGTRHVLVATGAGGGTTSVLRSLAAQAIARGARTDFLDITYGEHRWAEGLPGVRCLGDVAAIHDYLLLAAADLNNRRHDPAESDWGSRRVLVVEELARLADALRRYWLDTRPETQLDEAPGVEALSILLTSGRAYGWTVLAGDTGGIVPGRGPLHHRHFPTRILGYGSRLLWRQLAAGQSAPPRQPVTGRFHLFADRASTPLQALYLTEAQARATASSPSPGAAQWESA
ncbi:cell division protein FtsK (plasmid) [Streptomyces globisporus]|uniref:cell division protein FtsK n=1 Tax=Streptomyces globisporus TaxID=1908 RepID=UPI002F917F40|nr:cell division protein FtsK [Streptomyces globisporus]